MNSCHLNGFEQLHLTPDTPTSGGLTSRSALLLLPTLLSLVVLLVAAILLRRRMGFSWFSPVLTRRIARLTTREDGAAMGREGLPENGEEDQSIIPPSFAQEDISPSLLCSQAALLEQMREKLAELVLLHHDSQVQPLHPNFFMCPPAPESGLCFAQAKINAALDGGHESRSSEGYSIHGYEPMMFNAVSSRSNLSSSATDGVRAMGSFRSPDGSTCVMQLSDFHTAEGISLPSSPNVVAKRPNGVEVMSPARRAVFGQDLHRSSPLMGVGQPPTEISLEAQLAAVDHVACSPRLDVIESQPSTMQTSVRSSATFSSADESESDHNLSTRATKTDGGNAPLQENDA